MASRASLINGSPNTLTRAKERKREGAIRIFNGASPCKLTKIVKVVTSFRRPRELLSMTLARQPCT